MDMILEICELIPKQEGNFQTKKVIDRVCKDLNRNDIDTCYHRRIAMLNNNCYHMNGSIGGNL
jgi:hypothetical protein